MREFGLLVTLLCGMVALVPQSSSARPQPGEVALTHVLAIAKPYPNLVQQVRLALIRAGLKATVVSCASRPPALAAPRLAGQRTGPYDCRIGARRLLVTTRVVYFDKSGRRLDATDPTSLTRVERIVERGLTWSWR